ncbi:MAG TPA: hypothetical protein VFS87_11355 [Qipengyuania sp.]|nr:hypothetical protein [Qipengyuania sp.]
MMDRLKLLAALCAALIGTHAQAQSLVATPDAASRALGQCFVLKTTGSDRLLVARWLAGAMGVGDATKGMVSVDQAAKSTTDRQMAALYTRLLAKDCAAQAAPLVKAQDMRGIEAAGGMLGEIAMKELMNDPKVAAAIAAYAQHIDPAAFAALAE